MRFLHSFVPRFTEIDLFSASFIFALTLSVHAPKIFHLDKFSAELAPYVILFLSIVFIFLSTHHVFSSRNKNIFEKTFLVCMMLVLLIASQIILFLSKDLGNMHILLILINGIYIFWLILWLTNIGEYDRHTLDRMVPDGNMKINLIVPTATISFLAFYIMTFVLKMSWGLVFALLIIISIPLTKTFEHFDYLFGNSMSKNRILLYLLFILATTAFSGYYFS